MKSVNTLILFFGLVMSVSADEAGQPMVDHSAHHAALKAPSYVVSKADYRVPDVVLLNEEGNLVSLSGLLGNGRPVVVNFIFTSCTTICPVMTATMLQLQQELSAEQHPPQYISISIDPDFDSAPVLKAYARRFGASWTFLTGSRQDVQAVLQSFAAFRGAKSNHSAITLFRHGGGGSWSRVDGLASAKDLAHVWKHGAS